MASGVCVEMEGEVRELREVKAREELCEKDLLLSSKVGVVKDIRDTSKVITLLGEAAPLEMFGVSGRTEDD